MINSLNVTSKTCRYNHRFTQRLSAEENIKDYGIEQLLPNIHMLQR